jgi:hypothetical protein
MLVKVHWGFTERYTAEISFLLEGKEDVIIKTMEDGKKQPTIISFVKIAGCYKEALLTKAGTFYPLKCALDGWGIAYVSIAGNILIVFACKLLPISL